MTFQPTPGLVLNIQNKVYKIAEHPTAPGVPYGQEGRRAVVYQLIAEAGEKFALKVFKDRFRVPGMVGVAERLEQYANINGLQVCERVILTASRHRDLLTQYPELTYAVLMPWVEGSTWQEILISQELFSPTRSLSLAKSFAEMLVNLEEISLAHCDLSGANLIIQTEDQPALVDLEEMYNPDFTKPESLPAGSPGYAHKTAPKGLWNARSDRFAGTVLLIEMLCWHDHNVREAAWGESYFSPRDMQNENQRLDVLRQSLETYYGKRILDLFYQVWLSDSLRDCPTFAEWAVALPEKGNVVQTEPTIKETKPNEMEDPQELSGEIEKQIKTLEERTREEQLPSKTSKKEERYPARDCPDCGKKIPKGQEICPYCEGRKDLEPKPQEKLQKRKWGIWIGVTSILAVSLAVFVMRDDITSSFPEETVLPSVTPLNTHIPTKPGISPSPTVEVPSVLDDYLINPAITKIYRFDNMSGWSTYNSQTGQIRNGVYEMTGQPGWQSGLVRRNKRFKEGEGMFLKFKFTKSDQFEFVLERGTWKTDTYRAVGVAFFNYPFANLSLGTNELGFNNMNGEFRPVPDTWYNYMAGIGFEGDIIQLIWNPTDPSRVMTHRDRVGEEWDNFSWKFTAKAADKELILYIDDFIEMTFDEIKW